MKICIELNEEMKEMWEYAREGLEKAFSEYYEASVSLTDSEILKGILKGWDFAESACVPFFYAG